jgi:hypothetical protein
MCSVDCGTRDVQGNAIVVQVIDEALGALGAEIKHVDAPNVGTNVIARIGRGLSS